MSNALRMLRGTLVAAALAAVSSSCSTPTTLTHEWKDPSYAARPLASVVVFGLGLAPDTRHDVEDRFTSELAAQGVHAAPSYAVFGDAVPDAQGARATLARGGWDGALIVRLDRIGQRTRYLPTDDFYSTTPYGTPWINSDYQPGYVVTDKTVNVDTSLWDVRNGKRVWIGTSKTVDPKSSGDFAKSIAKEVLPELLEEGVLARSPRG